MNHCGPNRTSVSALMGAPILDAGGAVYGRVREFAVEPQVNAGRVTALLVRRVAAKRSETNSVIPVTSLKRRLDGALQMIDDAPSPLLAEGDDYLMLERDLLDQQIIDVHGHKVVRVNDVDLVWENPGSDHGLHLRVAEVEVGIRGALRRLLKGLPTGMVEKVSCRVGASVIPWDFVDLIDRDPSRRVRLKIEQEQLARMHPSDLADILEELAPKERVELFTSLDEEVAAEALEEVELKTQKTLIEAMDSETVAGILEEMDPGAAADLLAELSEERSDAILEQMDEKERHDVEELLEYAADSAAGLMTTEYVSVPVGTTVGEAISVLEKFDGDAEGVTDIFVVDADWHVTGVVAVPKLLFVARESAIDELVEGHVVSSREASAGRKVAEQFDKYNLRCLPVLDEDGCLVGVVHAEKVIAWLRTKQ